jgi:hypothetical protein
MAIAEDCEKLDVGAPAWRCGTEVLSLEKSEVWLLASAAR